MLVEQLKQQKDFSPIERSIADHFLEAGDALREQSARSIAAELYTAPSTVSRFCKHLGYSGYNEFRNAYLDELRYRSSAFADIDANQLFRASDDMRTIVDKMGALYRETVTDTLALVENESLNKAVDLLSSARTTVVYSAGTQAFLALDFSDKMARIGRQVIVPLKDDHAFFLGKTCASAMTYASDAPAMHVRAQYSPVYAHLTEAAELDAAIAHEDDRRRTWHALHTDTTRWGEPATYDLMINTDLIGRDFAAQLLAKLMTGQD